MTPVHDAWIAALLLMKFTVPVACDDTVAVSVTLPPLVDDVGDALSVVVEEVGETVKNTTPLVEVE
jgi:glycine cleavage system H lipoate-binding protein